MAREDAEEMEMAAAEWDTSDWEEILSASPVRQPARCHTTDAGDASPIYSRSQIYSLP